MVLTFGVSAEISCQSLKPDLLPKHAWLFLIRPKKYKKCPVPSLVTPALHCSHILPDTNEYFFDNSSFPFIEMFCYTTIFSNIWFYPSLGATL